MAKQNLLEVNTRTSVKLKSTIQINLSQTEKITN